MRNILLFFILISSAVVNGQTSVHWTMGCRKIKKNIYEISVSARLDEGWFIYAKDNKGGVAQPTTVKIHLPNGIMMVDSLKEIGELKQKIQQENNRLVGYFENEVKYTQQVKVVIKRPGPIKGTIGFMGCNEFMCLPPQWQDFELTIK